MSQIQITIPEYVRPPADKLWAWSDNGETVVWNTNASYDQLGETVAFAPQLSAILAELNDRLGGLPPLTCVLEVIEACSARWSRRTCNERLIQLAWTASRTRVAAITEWLQQVHHLSENFRSDLQSHVSVLTFALQDARQYLFEAREIDASDVIACLSVSTCDRDLAWAQSAAPMPSLARTKRTLEAFVHMSRRAIDDESIRLWRETNVSVLPQTEPLDTPPPKHPIARALRDLTQVEQYSALARSAIATASLITLPRHPSDPDHLPIGGVSDVTNRGEPERLLITELAQDPMVMLARIANGQALYLRRESPPGPSPDVRPVFLESGIRVWGETRLKIATVAMAIAAAEESRGDSQAKLLTVAGSRHFAEQFENADGIIQHLSRMETDEHPGEAIASWLASADESDELIAEPVAVISAATDADERFQRCLNSIKRNLLIARIQHNNSVTLLRRSPLGEEVLQSLSLQSVAVSPKTASATNPVVRTHESALALFLDLDRCPLRFTDSLDAGWFAATDAPGLFTITRDYRLLWFGTRGAGGVQLHDRLPHSYVHAYEANKDRIAMVVGHQEHFLVEADAGNGCTEVIPLSTSSDTAGTYHFDNGSLFRFGLKTVQLLDRQHGVIADQRDTYLSHIGASLCVGGNTLNLFHEQGGQIVCQDLSVDSQVFVLAARTNDDTIVALNHDYSQFVYFDGESPRSFSARSRVTRKAPSPPPKLVYRSVSGEVFVVSDQFAQGHGAREWSEQSGHLAVNLIDRTVKPILYSNRRSMLYQFDSTVYHMLLPRNYLSRFTGIEFNSDGTIALVKQKRKWILELDQRQEKLILRAAGSGTTATRHSFGRTQHLDRPYGRTLWNLRALQVGDNHVVADSRGLLHLRRGDDGTELTLMLHQDHVSGWASWGEVFGDQYYLSGTTQPVSAAALQWIEEFALQCNQSS